VAIQGVTRLLLALAIGVSVPAGAPASAAEPNARYVIIVAPSTRTDGLQLDDLRRLFLGVRVDVDGQRLVPLNFPVGSSDRVAFDRKLLDMSPDSVGRYWVDRKIRGEGEPPRTVTSARVMKQLVAAVPGLVGYIRVDQLDPSVRVIVDRSGVAVLERP